MAKAPQASYVTLPECARPYPTLLEFLERRFPKVGREVWQARLEQGKITDDAGRPLTPETPYQPHRRLCYYREVEREPQIPFAAHILFRNAHLLVACKPHFLPVTPAGPYVTQCLLYRLQAQTGLTDLVPVHRLDRETAGLVLFSTQKHTRGRYHQLFESGRVRKVYEAVTTLPEQAEQGEWQVESRIVPGQPWFRMRQTDGPVNARTHITLVARTDCHAYLRLIPATGKQHQLRLHVTRLGAQILHDRLYPVLQPKRPDDFAHPLQLLAKELHFVDPLTEQPLSFVSPRTLQWT
ncbi:pseudouridine synthase [candidate division KSB3 bacterium]|nr:pseudouridine synthase [candidate division KSB3 bacterium]